MTSDGTVKRIWDRGVPRTFRVGISVWETRMFPEGEWKFSVQETSEPRKRRNLGDTDDTGDGPYETGERKRTDRKGPESPRSSLQKRSLRRGLLLSSIPGEGLQSECTG